jgi:hypothetical protein
MNRNMKIAAAVAAALAANIAAAVPPTAGQANGAAHKLYVAGSSAAAGAVSALIKGRCAVAADFGAFQSQVFSPAFSPAGTPDFRAFSCTFAATDPTFPSQLVTVYYRAEGGSVMGVLPVYNNKQLNFLDLSAAGTCPAAATGNVVCPVGGSSGVNGIHDSFPTGVSKHFVEMGVADLEPAVFASTNNSPVGVYDLAVIGPPVSASNLQNHFTQSVVAQQTFEIVINNTPANLVGLNNLTRQTVQELLNGNFNDWHTVAAAPAVAGLNSTGAGYAGPQVAAAATPAIVCNREIGSGTRAASSIFFAGDVCSTGAVTPIAEFGTPADNFATSDELACVDTNPGAIGYVSVDNNSKIGAGNQFPNVTAVAIDGVLGTNKASASGQYLYNYEMAFTQGASTAASTAAALVPSLITAMQTGGTSAQSAQINVLPGIGTPANVSQLPLQQFGAKPIYTSLTSRGGNSCSLSQ